MSGSSRPLPADFAGRNGLPGQRLRALLADDLAYAGVWSELQRRLNRKVYELRESGGGLTLFHFPGHSHGYLAARWL